MEIRVVLVEPEHEGNIGLIARTMKNFGYDDLWLLNQRAEISLEARALASHAEDLLARVRVATDLEQALEGCDYSVATTAINARNPSNLCRLSLDLKEFAQKIIGVNGRAAVLFGRESRGLMNEEIARCDLVVTIPTRSNYRTLNIAVAVAITLYELQTARCERGSHPERASRETRMILLKMFEELARGACLPQHRIPLAKRALSNVISRSLISKREASLIVGVMRRAAERLDDRTRQPEPRRKIRVDV
ncbi:TrmJ/YjtD family RNA methyltransferase [Candidatus Bathyarchaeota archaeon]|nr:TrmJ/YjtD family RNA methyltransferase [Candidatus Bathyarchaeota archaeon]